MIPPAVILAVAAVLGCAGCTFNPVTGRPGVVLTSTSQEREIGSKEARKVEASMGLVDDAGLSTYVNAIGQRLVQQFPKGNVEYQFAVVDMAEPNAFALPGGFVYVSRGLLALVNSEDELANVIGHEIGHVAARHSSRQLTLATPFALATGLGSLATGIVSPALGNVVAGIGGLTSGLLLAPYSRQQENEADELGMELAARAGWDPVGMSKFLHTLEREEALRQGSVRKFSFFASHPTTPDRVRSTSARAGKLQRGSAEAIAAGREGLLKRLEGLLVGTDPRAGVFAGDRFLHPDLDISLRMPEEWSRENSRTAVSAVSPEGDAAFVLTSADGEDGNPAALAEALAEQLGVDPKESVRERTIAGRPAAELQAEARTDRGRLALAVTWIAHGGQVYQMTGLCKPDRFGTYAPTFRETAGSFRPLTRAERESVRESRLRIVRAREGETIETLVERNGGAWSGAEAAVANAIQVEDRLPKGEAVKVPIPQRYRGGAAPGA